MPLYLREDLRGALNAGALAAGDGAVFERIHGVSGEVFRLAERRRTVRFVAGGKAYFAKIHDGVGWREISKNLLVGKRPVLGARNEFDASRRLLAHGVRGPSVAAFGERGHGPARRRSFVVCDALEDRTDLETVVDGWSRCPPALGAKRQLIVAAGELARLMHDAGVQHRDFYLSHLLADAEALARGDADLAVIDLHRASLRRRMSRRQRCRDLAALLYSAYAAALSRTDRLRFIRAYAGMRPADELRRRGRFWEAVQRRSRRLAARAAAKGLATGAGALTDGALRAASVSALVALGREPPLPFRFDAQLGNADCGQRIVCTQLLRIQPGRRFVARATMANGTTVALKAFYGGHGRRDRRREERGMAALAASGAATPKLLASGAGAGGELLAFEYLAGAGMPAKPDLPALLGTLARLHEHGVRQRDLHAGNFLVHRGRVVAMDGGGVRRAHCAPARCWRDVAELMASMRLEPGGDSADECDRDARDSCPAAAREYAAARGWPLAAADAARLASELQEARRRHAIRWMAKTVRDCTPFVVRREPGRLLAMARGDDDPALAELVADPDAAIENGVRLKSGRTATVARCGAFVVKRYNVKNTAHRWRGVFHPTRARRAWQVGHALVLLGIPTARPRALIEMRDPRAGNAVAYLVMDRAAGIPLAEAIQAAGVSPPLKQGLSTLFRALREARAGHGDMKASNFVVDGDTVHLLDLDAATLPRSRRGFARRHQRDVARFLRDWPAAEQQALRSALQGG